MENKTLISAVPGVKIFVSQYKHQYIGKDIHINKKLLLKLKNKFNIKEIKLYNKKSLFFLM